MTNILVIEDEKSFAKLLKRSLEKEGISVELAATLDEGLARLELASTPDGRQAVDVVVADLYLDSRSALELVDQLRTQDPHLPVIIMTAKHTTDTAIEATKRGAYDYFAKPDAFGFDDGSQLNWPWVLELAEMIEKAAERRRLTAEVRLPEDAVSGDSKLRDQMIGRSRKMQDVFKVIGLAAASDITVLIRGETGTGKELAARGVYSHSARSAQPFIVVNCAAIPAELLESELFGHEKGAFTGAQDRRIGRFEQANRGTIFLDEIGDMSLPLQQKLLRVLQEKTIERLGGKEIIPVDVRVIAATHRNLELAIEEGEFRQDLYFRLNVAAINLPPLRERKEDIADHFIPDADAPDGVRREAGLARYFLERHGAELGSINPLITPEAIALLQEEQQQWPGNVRQLRNVVRKSLLLARGYAISPEVIKEAFAQMTPPRPTVDQTFDEYVGELLGRAKSGELENVQQTLAELVDRELYMQAIQRANGDQSKAARWLGISRPTMLEKLIRFGLHPTKS